MHRPTHPFARVLFARLLGVLLLVGVVVVAGWSGGAAADDDEAKRPLPRFESMGSNLVNMRTGPGRGHPIRFVITRKGLPVMIVDEFGDWRQIRHWDGETGWVHRYMTKPGRHLRVQQEVVLRTRPEGDAGQVARLMPGVIVELASCQPVWCKVDLDDPDQGSLEGWLPRSAVWGVFDGEIVE